MKVCEVKEFEFVVAGSTSWYSHFGQINSLLRVQHALQQYKKEMDSIHAGIESHEISENVSNMLDIITSLTFWLNISLVAKIY